MEAIDVLLQTCEELVAALQGLAEKATDEADVRRIIREEAARVAPKPPHGCICPVGAEATCKGLVCPRRAVGGAA